MKTLGIIAEYNPFHNGHLYHLNESKKIVNPDCTICIISGNFIQRGQPSIYNKWVKAKTALKAGINLVIELPTYYAVNNAENFSKYSIDIFNALNVSDISFGAETDNITVLKNIANILISEPDEYKYILKEELNKGTLFAKASEIAILSTLKDESYNNILNNSNNILAIEYLKAIKRTNSSIIPHAIKRTNNYLDTKINNTICSATAIRTALEKNENIKNVIPDFTYNIITKEQPKFLKEFEKEILFKIRSMYSNELKNILEVTEGLENRLKDNCFKTDDIYEFIQLMNTKRFTQTKISRILIHILLNMTKEEFENINNKYIRVLAFDNIGEQFLKENSKQCSIPIITSIKKYIDTYGNNTLLNTDILASNLYCKENNIDFTQKIIKE
ncbi:MAG: nucleotidyltransferase [Clostridia bacterium]|nr:nucleotidyltransferase [Clostridia bacterium]